MKKVLTIRPGIKVTASDKPNTKKICGPIPSEDWRKKKDEEEALLKSRAGVTFLMEPTVVANTLTGANDIISIRKPFEQEVFEHMLKDRVKLKQLANIDGKTIIGLFLKDEETPFTSLTLEKENGGPSLSFLWLTKRFGWVNRLYEQIRLPSALQSMRFKRTNTFDQV